MDCSAKEDQEMFPQKDKDTTSGQPTFLLEDLIEFEQIAPFARFVQEKLNALILPQTLVFCDRSPLKRDEKAEAFIQGFILHRVFASRQTRQKDQLFGAEPDESLYQGTTLVDIMLEYDVKNAYSSMLDSIKNALISIARNHKNISILRGAIIFRTWVCLMTIDRHSTEMFSTKSLCLWKCDDVAQLITSLSPWPVASVLEKLLEQMDLQLTDPPRCLGGGRLGSVFPVNASNSPPGTAPMALKVVVGEDDAAKLRSEFEANLQVAAAAPGAVVRAARFLVIESPPGAGMLMEEVGSPVAADAPGGLRRALQALGELHRASFHHGSARRDNLLECGDSYKWCDLQRAGGLGGEPIMAFYFGDPADANARLDLEELVRSFGHRDFRFDLATVRKYADAGYSPDVIEHVLRAAAISLDGGLAVSPAGDAGGDSGGVGGAGGEKGCPGSAASKIGAVGCAGGEIGAVDGAGGEVNSDCDVGGRKGGVGFASGEISGGPPAVNQLDGARRACLAMPTDDCGGEIGCAVGAELGGAGSAGCEVGGVGNAGGEISGGGGACTGGTRSLSPRPSKMSRNTQSWQGVP